MNLYDLLSDREGPKAVTSKTTGVVVGIVTNNQDPDKMGRVKLKFPWLSDEEEGYWARMAVPMAGSERGIYFLPEVNDEVLVAFEQGDARFPYVVGALWNGRDAPPAENGDGKNNVRVIKSRSGHVIRLTDEDGKEKIEIVDKSGNNSVVFDTAENTITITADKDIVLSASKGSIKLNARQIEIKSSADTKIEAGAGMDVKAGATMNIKGQVVNIN
ncbi:MAG: phage baseplate assembly protein V [Nitrospira sp.]|nr:phage baseplate assembly protein V [Nitrospira sp.]